MVDTLDGLRLRQSQRRLDRETARALARRGQVAYCVEEPKRETARAADHRGAGRQRTRLRSAKVLDAAGKFICECLVQDRSASGLRLALSRNLRLPSQFRLHDDETGEVDAVATVWRRGAVLGVRFTTALGPTTLKPSDRSALRGRYYAIPD